MGRMTVEQLEAEARQREQVLDTWHRALARLAEREVRLACSSPDPERLAYGPAMPRWIDSKPSSDAGRVR